MTFLEKMGRLLTQTKEKAEAAYAAHRWSVRMTQLQEMPSNVPRLVFLEVIGALAKNPCLSDANADERKFMDEMVVYHHRLMTPEVLSDYLQATKSEVVTEFLLSEIQGLQPEFEQEVLMNDKRAHLLGLAYVSVREMVPELMPEFASTALIMFPRLPAVFGKRLEFAARPKPAANALLTTDGDNKLKAVSRRQTQSAEPPVRKVKKGINLKTSKPGNPIDQPGVLNGTPVHNDAMAKAMDFALAASQNGVKPLVQ